ncbi:MAG TPA: AAC(3) family N-acetyltransferase [Solirubrobacterales bacterium]|nr:AAC(3) family N-acetyltransferase [Solirubrobacterales bacterium]
MNLGDALNRGLRAVIRPEDEFVVLHSSLFHVAETAASLRRDALEAVRELTERGHTLALPAFTFSFIHEGRYHYRDSPSGSGLLADWVSELPEARRTPHPVYSHVVLGPRLEELMGCRHDTAFGEETVFELLESANARIVMVGADWQSLTQVHRYEELLRVPYREPMRVEGTADFGAGEQAAVVDLFVRDAALESVRDFSPVIEELHREGMIDRAEVGRGTVEATSCDCVRLISERVIRRDPFALVRIPPSIERRLHRHEPSPTAEDRSDGEGPSLPGGPVASAVERVVREILEVGPSLDLSNAGLGDPESWTSLAQIEILVALEDEFDIAFTSAELSATPSLVELKALVARKLS